MDQNEQQYVKIYKQLQPNYVLINIHDIYPYELQDLKSLASRLESQFTLENREQIIHNELIQKSKYNSKVKKEKRKEKKNNKEMKEEVPSSMVEDHSFFSGDLDFSQISNNQELYLNQSNLHIQESFIMKPSEKVVYSNALNLQNKGKIYNGKMLIELKAQIAENQPSKSLRFQILPTEPLSKINKDLLLKNVKIDKNGRTKLWIEGIKTQFVIQSIQQNVGILGLDFLRTNNLILQCDFRPQYLNFTMKFPTK